MIGLVVALATLAFAVHGPFDIKHLFKETNKNIELGNELSREHNNLTETTNTLLEALLDQFGKDQQQLKDEMVLFKQALGHLRDEMKNHEKVIVSL